MENLYTAEYSDNNNDKCSENFKTGVLSKGTLDNRVFIPDGWTVTKLTWKKIYEAIDEDYF